MTNHIRAYKITLNELAKEHGIELKDDYPCNMVKELLLDLTEIAWGKGSLEAFNNVGRTIDLLQMSDECDEDGLIGIDWWVNALHRDRLKVRLAALGEAAKAQCTHCAEDVEDVIKGEDGWFHEIDYVEPDIGFGSADRTKSVYCHAHAIRALMGSGKEGE